MRRFRAGMVAGSMTDAGLVISQEMADHLNEIVVAYNDLLDEVESSGGRLEVAADGTLHAEPEVPETFHARLAAGDGPAYAWFEVARTSAGWEGLTGGRNSTTDGTAREYNGATGLGLLVVLMQRWPNGVHRFVTPVVDDAPIIECPTTLTVRVREYCSDPYSVGDPISGATVTAADVDGILTDVSDTTDADGLVSLVLDNGGGTFDVTVELPDGCTEVIEDVVMEPCERKTLPDVAPCCGTVCVEAYDYDSGSPVTGATLTPWGFSVSPLGFDYGADVALDSGGLGCFPYDRARVGFRIQATGYGDVFHSVCECDCTTTPQTYPVAMFPSSVYYPPSISVFNGLSTHNPATCEPTTPDCTVQKTIRPPFTYRRRMFVDLAGPEPIFGSGGVSALPVDFTTDVDGIITWDGWTTGGYGTRRRSVTTIAPGGGSSSTVITEDRFDFPAARARITSGFLTFFVTQFSRSTLQWTNFIDAEGTIPARVGHVFEDSRSTAGDGTITVVLETLEAVGYCFSGDFATLKYPFEVINAAAMLCPGLSEDDACGTTTAGQDRWIRDGTTDSYGRDVVSDRMLAPVDVAGTFWCGRSCGSGYYSGTTPTATYAVYE